MLVESQENWGKKLKKNIKRSSTFDCQKFREIADPWHDEKFTPHLNSMMLSLFLAGH